MLQSMGLQRIRHNLMTQQKLPRSHKHVLGVFIGACHVDMIVCLLTLFSISVYPDTAMTKSFYPKSHCDSFDFFKVTCLHSESQCEYLADPRKAKITSQELRELDLFWDKVKFFTKQTALKRYS